MMLNKSDGMIPRTAEGLICGYKLRRFGIHFIYVILEMIETCAKYYICHVP